MSAITYVDFDIHIERSDGGYRIGISALDAQQASATFTLPFSDVEIENFILKIGRAKRAVRRIDAPEVAAAKAFGDKLFSAVFPGELRAVLRSSLDEAEDRSEGLRIRLNLTQAPELADLPWEYLYNQALDRFLALSVKTPVVRYLELPVRVQPLEVTGPVSILVVVSSPADHPALDVEREWTRLEEALGGLIARGLVRLERLPAATLEALRSRLRQGHYHILHFIGHGGFDAATQDGVLVFEDEDRRSRPVGGPDLGVILHDHNEMRLAVLNACEGARAARNDPFAGVAQSLVRQGLAAVAAMQFEISDEAAIAFAKEFYSAIADNYPVDAAVAEARKAIYTADNALEWGTPVLYMRAPDGRIFDVSVTPSRPAPSPSPGDGSAPSPIPVPVPAPVPPDDVRPVPPPPRPWRRWAAAVLLAAVAGAAGIATRRLWPAGPDIRAFSVEPSVVSVGDPLTVRWEVRGADRIQISPAPAAPRLDPAKGSATLAAGRAGAFEVTLQAFRGNRVAERAAAVRVRLRRPAVKTFTSSLDGRAPGRVTLHWDVADASEVQISPRVGTVGPRGSTTVDAPRPGERVEYRLEARNADHEPVVQTLIVTALPRPPVIVQFSVQPTEIARGQPTALVWSVEGAERIVVNGAVGVLQRPIGRRAIAPAASFTYELTATNSSGSVTRSASVVVRPHVAVPTARPTRVAAPTPRPTRVAASTPRPTPGPAFTSRAIGARALTATPTIVNASEAARICWEGIEADQARIDPDIGVIAPEEFAGGCRSIRPAFTRTYTLSVFGPSGRQVGGRVTVEVRLVAELTTRQGSGQTEVCWSVLGARSARIDPDIGDLGADAHKRDCRVVAPRASTAYTLTAVDGEGQETRRQVTVEPRGLAARIVSFTAERAIVRRGDSTRLCWVVENPRSVRIESVGPALSPILAREMERGCREVAPNATTVFFLTVVGLDGREVQATVNVAVPLR